MNCKGASHTRKRLAEAISSPDISQALYAISSICQRKRRCNAETSALRKAVFGDSTEKKKVAIRTTQNRDILRRKKGSSDYPEDGRGKHTKQSRSTSFKKAQEEGVEDVRRSMRYSASLCDDCGASPNDFVLSSDKDCYVCTQCGNVLKGCVVVDGYQNPKDIPDKYVSIKDPLTEWAHRMEDCGIRTTKAPINPDTGTTYNGGNYAAERVKQARNVEPQIPDSDLQQIAETYYTLATAKEHQGLRSCKNVIKNYKDLLMNGPIIPPLNLFSKEHIIRVLNQCNPEFVDKYAENWVQVLCYLAMNHPREESIVVGELLDGATGELLLAMYQPFYLAFHKHHKKNEPGQKNGPKLDMVFLHFMYLMGGTELVQKYGRYFVGKWILSKYQTAKKTMARILEICDTVYTSYALSGNLKQHFAKSYAMHKGFKENDKSLAQYTENLTYLYPLTHFDSYLNSLNAD